MKNNLFYLPIMLIVMSAITGCENKKPASQADTFFQLLQNSTSKVEDVKGNVISPDQLVVERKWNGKICGTTLKNIGNTSLHPANIILFDITEHGLNADSPIYGEGFQMLHQNGGTLAKHEVIGGNAVNKL